MAVLWRQGRIVPGQLPEVQEDAVVRASGVHLRELVVVSFRHFSRVLYRGMRRGWVIIWLCGRGTVDICSIASKPGAYLVPPRVVPSILLSHPTSGIPL